MGELERLRAGNEELRRENAELRALVAQLRARIEELEALLARSSRNSSLPPSQDPPWRRSRPPVKPSGRKAGAQPGHAGKARPLVPPEQVDEVVDCLPDRCPVCAEPLPPEAERVDARTVQVTDLPEVRPTVTEYRLWRVKCPRCGGRGSGQLPPGTPKGTFGPRVQAMAALLCGRFRLSRREAAGLMAEGFGVAMGTGTVQSLCEATSEAVAPAAEAVHARVRTAPALYLDETGFGRCGKDRMWLWGAATGTAEAFRVLPGRGARQLKALVPEGYDGLIHRDRWKPYEALRQARHQLCHAHLRRDFQALIDRGGAAGKLGRWLLAESDRAFALWHRFRDGELDRPGLQRAMVAVRMRMRRALTRARDAPELAVRGRGLARDLLRQWEALWTFAEVEGAVPTNNEAERALRKAVLWRKGSFGAQSEAGCRFVERMLTLAGTARKRGIRLLTWLYEACRAHLNGQPLTELG